MLKQILNRLRLYSKNRTEEEKRDIFLTKAEIENFKTLREQRIQKQWDTLVSNSYRK